MRKNPPVLPESSPTLVAFTLEEVATRLRTSTRTVRRFAEAGLLRPVGGFSKRLRFSVPEFARFLSTTR